MTFKTQHTSIPWLLYYLKRRY